MKKDLICLLAIACIACIMPACKRAKPVSFGIFEVVDCAQSQTAPVLFPVDNQKYCLASKAILAENDLRAADVIYNSVYGTELSLHFTPAGGDRLHEETRRISEMNQQHNANGRVAVMVDGKILAATVVRVPMPRDMILINSVFKKGEAEQLAASLNATAANR
jgi:preprotein translocase subunit SecD